MSDKSYIDWLAMSNVALAQTIGTFVKHHRLQQNRTQGEVAEAAGISRSTLSLLERGEGVTLPSLLQVLRVLDLLKVMDAFKIQQQVSPIALAKLEKQKRQRASSNKENNLPKSDW